MGTLYYNPETKVIFESDDAQSDSIQKIDASQIENLVHIGATIDASVNQDILQPGVDLATGTAGVPDPTVPAIPDPTTPTSTDTTSDMSATDTATTQKDGDTVAASPDVSTATDVVSPTSTATEVADAPVTTPTAQAITTVADQKKADEQAVADAGVDTTKDVANVAVVPNAVGSVTGTAVTPDGTPVVEAQPQAVTVAGAVYPANSPAVSGVVSGATTKSVGEDTVADTGPALPPTYANAEDHKSLIEVFLKDMEGIPAMGKAEIHMFVDFMRHALQKL